jgi:hypothetical protein
MPALADPAVRDPVVRQDGLLEPERRERSQHARAPDRLARRPLLVGVQHQEDLGAHQPADRAHALHVLLRVVAADLHLHGPVAAVEEPPHLVEERLTVEVHVDAAAVGADPVAGAAEQTVEGHAGVLRQDVPEGDVHRRDGVAREPARAERVELPPAAVPHALHVPGVLPVNQRGQVRVDELADRGSAEPTRVGEAGARHPGIRGDRRHDPLPVTHALDRVLDPDGGRHAVQAGRDILHAHGRGSLSQGGGRRCSVSEQIARRGARCQNPGPARRGRRPRRGAGHRRHVAHAS